MRNFPNDKRHIALRTLLRQMRKNAALDQTELANKLDRPQSYVSKYEIGERRLDLVDVYLITDALGMPFPEFAKAFDKAVKRGK